MLQALREAAATDQVSDQVKALLKCLATKPASALECMKKLGLSHRPTFRKNYLQPALEAGLIERTLPDKPSRRGTGAPIDMIQEQNTPQDQTGDKPIGF